MPRRRRRGMGERSVSGSIPRRPGCGAAGRSARSAPSPVAFTRDSISALFHGRDSAVASRTPRAGRGAARAHLGDRWMDSAPASSDQHQRAVAVSASLPRAGPRSVAASLDGRPPQLQLARASARAPTRHAARWPHRAIDGAPRSFSTADRVRGAANATARASASCPRHARIADHFRMRFHEPPPTSYASVPARQRVIQRAPSPASSIAAPAGGMEIARSAEPPPTGTWLPLQHADRFPPQIEQVRQHECRTLDLPLARQASAARRYSSRSRSATISTRCLTVEGLRARQAERGSRSAAKERETTHVEGGDDASLAESHSAAPRRTLPLQHVHEVGHVLRCFRPSTEARREERSCDSSASAAVENRSLARRSLTRSAPTAALSSAALSSPPPSAAAPEPPQHRLDRGSESRHLPVSRSDSPAAL